MKFAPWLVLSLIFIFPSANAQTPKTQNHHRNIIIFVADGLRHGSVNATDTPALYAVRTKGVNFQNSYSLYPTFTTANASAIATGHRLGDTGDFANALYTGFRVFDTHNFQRDPGTIVPFIENDQILADLDSHKHGNYLNETTLLEAAHQNGYNTAAIGKLGPTGIQDAAELNPANGEFSTPMTIIIDDGTAHNPYSPDQHAPTSIPLPKPVLDRLLKLHIPVVAPGRTNGYPPHSAYDNGYVGDAHTPGTLAANVTQQQWMTEVATRAVLPMFAESSKPFVLLFWSRDPDASQHDHGDSLNRLAPGINGPTSKLGVQNADHCLHEIMEWLDAHPAIKANTDIFVTSDHGFATGSRHEIDRNGAVTHSEAARHLYYNASGKLDTPQGFLPQGFLSMDLAIALKTNLWDPDVSAPAGSSTPYKQVKLSTEGQPHPNQWEHPHGSGLLGDTIHKADGSDALAIVAANGGSDLIYVPDRNPQTVQRIVKALLGFDYIGGIFVDDQYGKVPGTLPLSLIDLVGSSRLPRPSIVVAFKTFYLHQGNLMEGIEVSDASLQEGQGMHGGFGREVTWNNMAAIGPDFKSGYVDHAPIGNADITPTLAHILGIKMVSNGKLGGRVATEAFAGQPDAKAPKTEPVVSEPDPDHHLRTVLFLQRFDGRKYFDSACMTSSKTIEPDMCHPNRQRIDSWRPVR